MKWPDQTSKQKKKEDYQFKKSAEKINKHIIAKLAADVMCLICWRTGTKEKKKLNVKRQPTMKCPDQTSKRKKEITSQVEQSGVQRVYPSPTPAQSVRPLAGPLFFSMKWNLIPAPPCAHTARGKKKLDLPIHKNHEHLHPPTPRIIWPAKSFKVQAHFCMLLTDLLLTISPQQKE